MEAKNYALTFAAVVAAAIFCYAVFVVGTALLPKEHGEGANESSPYEILLRAAEKPAGYDTYTYAYVDDIDGYPIETRMVKSRLFSTLKVQSPVFEKAIYSAGGADALCISFYGNTSCSQVDANSSLAQSFSSMNSSFLGGRTERNVNALAIYNRSGAMAFEGGVGESEVGGKKCQLIKYVLDYSKLTLVDLRDLGMSPNDPVLLYSKDYTFEYCIDNESNTLSAKLDYTYLGEPRETITLIKEALWGSADAAEAVHPALGNTNETEALFLEAINVEKNVLSCARNATTKDACVRNYAVSNDLPDLCLLAGGAKDRCILTLAPQALRSDLCPSVDNASFRDDCWIEMGARKKNASFCENVLDVEKRSYCASLLANSTNSTANASVCAADSQCFTAGCSAQLCVPESGKGTITTCEMRPEFECLKFTTCGCVQNRCEWKNNENYMACMQSMTGANASS
ncbi:MAG: eight-cysteine-cluster domain-containing protein [Candidatus Micrarchaeia archaeon]